MQITPHEEATAHFNTRLDSDEVGFDNGVPTSEDLTVKSHEAELSEKLVGGWHGLILPLAEEVTVGAPQCHRPTDARSEV